MTLRRGGNLGTPASVVIDEITFLRSRLDDDENERWDVHYGHCATAGPISFPCDCGYPARVLREVAVWRRLLLDYSIPPGTDAVYGGTERETGFRLALGAALKAKIATYDGNPVTGEPFPREG